MMTESDIKKIVKKNSCCVTKWATATRPSTPFLGQNGFNTDTGLYEYWNGTLWISPDDYIDPSYMVSVLYDDLVTMRNASNLKQGVQYRITDYTCTTVQADTRSEGNDFDIIVVADSNNKLNETARAIRRAGDTYFPSDTLFEAWELKYCIDNDTDRFAWADSVNGKGVIYYLKDEWNNEAAYDFKSITFCNLNTAGVDTYNNLPNDGSQYYYTFNLINTARNNGDYATCMSLDATIYNNVNISNAPGQISGVHFCNFGTYKDDNKRKLNKVLLFVIMSYGEGNYSVGIGDACYNFLIGSRSKSIKVGDNCKDLTFGDSCNSLTFGEECYSMAFGDNCNSLTFGEECSSMTFGGYCSSMTLGGGCNSMTFGEECYSMTFGGYCSSMTFGYYCYSMTFGDYCSSMTFGGYCSSMNLGGGCYSMTFGEGCYSMTFGGYCSSMNLGVGCYSMTFGYYCYSMTFGDYCSSMTFGGYCSSMNLGGGCYSMTFGDSCNSLTFGNGCISLTFGGGCTKLTFGEGCYSMTFGKACNNLMLPDNSTYGTINVLGAVTGGSGMDLADNDPTLFQTWLGAGNESNVIEIRQVKKTGAESTWKYIAQYIDVNGILQTKTKTGTAGTWV
jgi:hypothetical protein